MEYLVTEIFEDYYNDIIIKTSRNTIKVHGTDVNYYPADYLYSYKRFSYVLSVIRPGQAEDTGVGYLAPGIREQMNDHFFPDPYTSCKPLKKTNNPKYPVYARDSFFIFSPGKKPAFIQKSPVGYIRFLNDSLIAQRGNYFFSIYNVKSDKPMGKFTLPCKINEIFLDREGEYWFSTKGQGVYKLISPAFESYKCISDGINFSAINIQEKNNEIYAADDNGSLWKFNEQDHSFSRQEHAGNETFFSENILINPYQTFNGITDQHKVKRTFATKSVVKYGDTILLASAAGVYLVNLKNLHMTDSITGERATCAYEYEGAYYTGTLNGLFKINKDRRTTYLGKLDKGLSSRISFMAVSGDGILWVATYGYGVIGIRHDKIIATVTQLRDKLCLSLFICNNVMWVGTDKGLYKVELSSGKYATIAHYGMFDGLSSDIINCVYTKDDKVFAGTPMGLNVFRENVTADSSLSVLYITKISVSGNDQNPEENNLSLSHTDNNISFEFSGISFRSGDLIQYKYKLTGLDDDWKITKESSLRYPSLPAGKYELQIMAINRFGKSSPAVSFRFTVRPSYWQLWWVKLMMFGLFAIIIAFIISERNTHLRKKAVEKMRTEKRMTELEQMALRAQMNPHFIFNCLNSIQGYIVRQDIKGSNAFLARFAALIRQTLENSPKLSISLSEEIEYLENYIELERVQMNGSFEFEIRNMIEPEYMKIMIPNMVVQPYVENAIKHGMKTTGDKIPRLIISFTRTENMFTCTVEDNGSGINSEKSKSNSGHISRGMSITDRRVDLINLLNKSTKQKMTVEVKDISRLRPGETGTQVILKFPLNKN